MKKFLLKAFVAVFFMAATQGEAATYGFVNFKEVVEKSKLGKQEQATFDSLKSQMEKVLEEKDKELGELAAKFNDPDYMDSLSPEAENEMKFKVRQMSQEMSEKQNQFYGALQNAQGKIMQKLAEAVAKSSEKVAKTKQLDAAFNQDATFWAKDTINITSDVIKDMDANFTPETKK
ncbi:MAG: OmpH family outer membrane protein [Chlamydiia bacterium]|nr:OmpH family outer membrane protein [Chlamydiia bacterium]